MGSQISIVLSKSEPSSIDFTAGNMNEKNTQLQQAEEEQTEKDLCTARYRVSFKVCACERMNQEKKRVAAT